MNRDSGNGEIGAAAGALAPESGLTVPGPLRYRSLFERAPVGIAIHAPEDGRLIDVNEALLRLTGYERAALMRLGIADLIPQATAAEGTGETESVQLSALRTSFGPIESECVGRDGSRIPILLTGILTAEDDGPPVAWSIVQDFSSRKALESRIAAAAMVDRLTGLANRTRFNDQLAAALERIRDGRQARLGVLFLDFDRFKLVNDTLGHAAGDDLLCQIADRLRRALRRSDSVEGNRAQNQIARFGGDEFVILINDLKRVDDALSIASRLLDCFAPAYKVKGQELTSTASIGIVVTETAAETAEEIVRNADVAMYEAKRSGRGCAVVFNDAMHARLSRQVQIESGLRRAFGTRELWLAYQPIVDLQTGRMVYAEAFARWTHPEMGEVPPAEFVRVAEDRGLIIPLGEWILQESCRQLRAWIDCDAERAPARISVNLSRRQLATGDSLVERIVDILREFGLSPDRLQIEITEGEVARDPEADKALLNRLRDIGVLVAMDDFGAGSSSLACLREYPFDAVKIDRSFLGDLGAGHDVLAVLHATVTLVENLGMASIAEGVESATQAALLQSLGCRYAQGFLYGEAVPPAQFFRGASVVDGGAKGRSHDGADSRDGADRADSTASTDAAVSVRELPAAG